MLDWVIKDPDDVFPRVFPLVAEMADHGDAVSREILGTAAESLADLTAAVVDKLKMRDRELAMFKFGGTVGRANFSTRRLTRRSARRFSARASVRWM